MLKDVAERANVSLSTASAVLANKQWVSDETRETVRSAATELGYQPGRRRQSASQVNVDMIGLITRSPNMPLPANPFYSHVLHGVQRTCAEYEIGLSYEVVEADATHSHRLPLMLRRKNVRGLLMLGYFDASYVEDVYGADIPVVMIDHRVESVAVDSVCNDDELGGYLATRHLIEAGHVSPPPAIITGPSEHFSIRGRLAGYRRALAEFGLQCGDDYVQVGDLTPSGGSVAISALLNLEKPPTAVFCCNDSTALGALNMLRERGITVPQDCSVIGYDDIDTAQHCAPPLSTIAVDKELLGAQGVKLLLERIQSPNMPRLDIRVGVKLVERKSVTSPG